MSYNNQDESTKNNSKYICKNIPYPLISYLESCNSVIKFFNSIDVILMNYNRKKLALTIKNKAEKESELNKKFVNAIIKTLHENIVVKIGEYNKNTFPPLLIHLIKLYTQEAIPDADKLAMLLMGRKYVDFYSNNMTDGVQSETILEIAALYKQQNDRIRNCHKRYANAMKKFQLLPQNGNYYLIQLNFGILNDKTLSNSELSKNFVNRFIALRNKKQYKEYFTGLVGYMKKLILVNDREAKCGMISLIFNQSNPNFSARNTDIQSNYLEFASHLNELLCDMAKNDDITIESGFSIRFAPTKFTHSDCIAFIPKLITFYAYSDFIISLNDNNPAPNQEDNNENKGKLRAFEVTFYGQ